MPKSTTDQQPSVSGSSANTKSADPQAQFAEAVAIAQQVGRDLATKCCNVAPRLRRKVVGVFRRQLLPPGKPGPKFKKEITAAFVDWQAGLRGIALYRKHVPGFNQMSHWKRRGKMHALREALRARARRQEKRDVL